MQPILLLKIVRCTNYSIHINHYWIRFMQLLPGNYSLSEVVVFSTFPSQSIPVNRYVMWDYVQFKDQASSKAPTNSKKVKISGLIKSVYVVSIRTYFLYAMNDKTQSIHEIQKILQVLYMRDNDLRLVVNLSLFSDFLDTISPKWTQHCNAIMLNIYNA